MLEQRQECFAVGLLVQRFATVCDEWTANLFEIRREVEECLGPQEETARHFLSPTQTQSPSERVPVGIFGKRLVAVATLRAEADRPGDCLEQRRLASTVLANEECDRCRQLQVQTRKQPRHREWMNARLYSIFTQRDVSQERASGQSRPGIKTFACHHKSIGMFARFGFAVFLTLAYALSIMNWQDYISITPGVRSGKPCVRGTRITVSDVLEYLAGGMDEQAILADFPELRREHIQAVLGFAAFKRRTF